MQALIKKIQGEWKAAKDAAQAQCTNNGRYEMAEKLGGILLDSGQFVEYGIARAVQIVHALYEGIGMPLNGRQAGISLESTILRL